MKRGSLFAMALALLWPRRAKSAVQSELKWVPVGQDLDGQIKPIEDMTFGELNVRPMYYIKPFDWPGERFGGVWLIVCGPVSLIDLLKESLTAHSTKRGSKQHDVFDGYETGGLSDLIVVPSDPCDQDATAVMFAIVNDTSASVKMHPPVKYEFDISAAPMFIKEPERPKSGPCTHWRRPGTLCCAWCGSTDWRSDK